MKIEELVFAAKCLGFERRVFHYFRHRYAFLILERLAVDGLTVSGIKQSNFACLVNKPAVKEYLGRFGSGELGPEHFASAWLDPRQNFCLSLGGWKGKTDSYGQVSRPGHNLVLRLNFSRQHMRDYIRLYRPTKTLALNYRGHPVNRDGRIDTIRETLAWARIDFDLETGEALIEEIQTDWCRRAQTMVKYAKWLVTRGEPMPERAHTAASAGNVIEYVEKTLGPYAACWHEAVLAAAIVFIRDELGIRNIYYHTAESGHKVKRIRYDKPPRSLYSKLPRSFGFRKTQDTPQFLREDRSFSRLYKKLRPIFWYVLNFPKSAAA
jgi:hypothetical protein